MKKIKTALNGVIHRFPKLFHWICYMALSLSASAAMAADPNVWEGDIDKGFEALNTAVILSVVIGVVVVAVGFVLGGIKFMKDDMQGSKDVIVKCFVAGAVVAMAPTIVKFIVGAFKLDNLTGGLR